MTKQYWTILSSIEETEDCIGWKGAKDSSGHGVVQYKGKYWGTHRLSYLLHCGDPGALWVLHKCDNKACVNPKHLYLGTGKQNAADRQRDRGSYQLKGAACSWAKLTKGEVKAIRWCREKLKAPIKQLAKNFQVSKRTIKSVIYYENWKSV